MTKLGPTLKVNELQTAKTKKQDEQQRTKNRKNSPQEGVIKGPRQDIK